MKLSVHVHVHHDPVVLAKLDAIASQGAHIMAATSEITAFAARLAAATDEIARDIAGFKDLILAGGKPSAEDIATLEQAVARLERMGTDPENPVPDPEPVPDPAIVADGEVAENRRRRR